ncbi:hypothetical protein EB118_12580 [bacterium]|nr:hypothetical protein [bacterium]NDD83062.1 hypothetical protein [bacterium]NDG30895.1 hypothetical protein [bacterium]
MNGRIMLANAISFFHACIVLFVLLAPFLGNPALWILHITFCISLLVHWWGNSNVCSLSYMESALRGLDYTESFTHKFISPVYDISKTEWSKICNDITIILLLISVYYLYNSKALADSIACYKQRIKLGNKSRLQIITECFHPLFVIC